MKFKLEDLKNKKDRCIEKLASEILEDNVFKAGIDENDIKKLALFKAGQIINDFLSDKLKSNPIKNFDTHNFGLTYCEKNDINIVELEYRYGSVIWAGDKLYTYNNI